MSNYTNILSTLPTKGQTAEQTQFAVDVSNGKHKCLCGNTAYYVFKNGLAACKECYLTVYTVAPSFVKNSYGGYNE